MAKNEITDGSRRRPAMGMELFEITPIILGGDPVDPKNKTWLTREQHFQAVRYWNRVIRDLSHTKAD